MGKIVVSTNISKQKRDALLDKIQQIKKFISAGPQDENTANLLTYIGELTKEINGKKYGLVFEEHREKIDELLEENAPVLVEQEDLFIDNGGEMNFLIEGDNLAALKLLEKTHKGKIDVIYIDPPYNTGSEDDFIYDDCFITKTDTFTHSKWLSFLSNRLVIAKSLLKDTGVIFISIDDNEQAALKMLSDEIFSKESFISCFCIIRAEGGGLAKQVVKGHDYCLVYAKNINHFTPLARNKDIRGKIIEKNGIQYWIQEDWLRKEFGKYGNCHYEEIEKYKGLEYKKEVDSEIEKGNYVLIKKENGLHIVGKLRRVDSDSSKFYSVLKHLNKDGANELRNIGITFDYPKPISLISELIKGATFFSKNSTILDFFAGSGTTGHAVMKLNAEDGGNRKFILCTNNENNICQDVTYQRLKTVITGKRKDGSDYDENYKASLKYFKIDYLPIKDKMYYEYADELLEHVKELVELENAIDFNTNKSVAIVLDDDELTEFVGNIADYPECKTLYMGHDVLTSYQQEQTIKAHGITINTVPDYYYRDLAN